MPEHAWTPEIALVDQFFRLNGLVAVVTGGAGLYGKPIVRALAEAGADVVIASRNREQCDAYAATLREEGWRAEGAEFDQGSRESIDRFASTVLNKYGHVDVLVNNAVRRSPTHYTEASESEWDEVLRVNVSGVHWCTAAFSAGMRERKRGSIINIGSIYGMVAPNFRIYEGESFSSPPDYAFVKGGIIAYTRYCASLFAPDGVRVNCISPGGYYSGQADTFCAKYNARVPLGRMAEDADIAGPVVFLASEASRYVTGINLAVDGGLSAR